MKSIRLFHIASGRGGSTGFPTGGAGAGANAASGRTGTEPAPAVAGFASGRPAWESSGFNPVDATLPFLKNGVSARATSAGV